MQKYAEDFSVQPVISSLFSAANLALAGFPQTNALGENLPSRYLNMFILRLCNAATIRYSILKCGHMHLCGKGYNYFSPHCCKCNSFGCIAAIRCGNACHGPHSDSVYSGCEHCQYNSPRLGKREADFPSPRQTLIGSYQLWRVNDSLYYRELQQAVGWGLLCPCLFFYPSGTFSFAKICHYVFLISCSYLADVIWAKLWWYLQKYEQDI